MTFNNLFRFLHTSIMTLDRRSNAAFIQQCTMNNGIMKKDRF